MLVTTLNEIEGMISRLSRRDQLWLVERLVQRLREDSERESSLSKADFGEQLRRMAADPQIRAELQQINLEFTVAEKDGLERG